MARPIASSCFLALAALLLPACGEDRGPKVTVSGANLTAEEKAAADRVNDFIESQGNGANLTPEQRAAMAKMKDMMGKDGALASLPKANRPLTAADVEKFLKVMPEVKKLGKSGGDLSAVGKIAQAHGMSIPEWAIIHTRIISAAHGLQTGVPYAQEDDAAVVAPFKDRVLEAIKND